MKRVRFILALAFLMAAAIFELAAPTPALATQTQCLWQPGALCEYHCTNPCKAGCCGDEQRWAWSS